MAVASAVQIRGDPHDVQHAIHRSPCAVGTDRAGRLEAVAVRSDNDVRLTIPHRSLLGQKEAVDSKREWGPGEDASGPQQFFSSQVPRKTHSTCTGNHPCHVSAVPQSYLAVAEMSVGPSL
jgi:hypothetical protein